MTKNLFILSLLLLITCSLHSMEFIKNVFGVEKNKLGKAAKIADLSSCIRCYNSLYQRNKDEKNNRHFLDTILPVLFEGHDFSATEEKEVISYSDKPQSLIISAHANPYLMSSLLYTYGLSVQNYDAYGRKSNINGRFLPYIISLMSDNTFILDGKEHSGEMAPDSIAYLKAILTPPASFIQKAHKDVLPKVTTFMLCLARLKTANPASYKLPRCLF